MTDQLGDTVTFAYDMANRLLQRDYRLKANSPSGAIADSDTFPYAPNGNGVVTTWTWRDDGATKRDNTLDTIATPHPAGVIRAMDGSERSPWQSSRPQTRQRRFRGMAMNRCSTVSVHCLRRRCW